MGTITPLILVAILAFTAAVPTGIRNSCARSCSESSKFSYDQGTSYAYDYEVSTTFLESSNSLDNDVTVKGKATVGVLGSCEFVLSMSDISLEGSSETEQFASKVSQKPLRFAFDDGKISDICPSDDEEEWVLNFKRGVLSNFQNSMKTLENQETVTEIDITGECKTTYDSVALSSDTTQITKTKSANDCTRTPVGSQTTLPKQFQNMPIISADVTCEQTVTGGVMKETHCTELIAMKPLTSDNHATTLIKTKMQLTSETSGVISADFSNMMVTTLEFKNDESTEDDPLNFTTIESLLSELESKSSPVMSKEVPALFSDLVKRLKNLDTRQMSHLYGSFKASNAWKFLIDAAPLVSTAASTSIMTELVKEGDVTTKEADIWYSSLAFVQNPDTDMFIPLTNLIHQVSNKNAIMGAASLLKHYCQTDSNCMSEESVTGLVSAIEQKLGSACRSTTIEEKENILVVLRALKIVGQWNKQDVLSSCFMDVSNPSEIRVAAIETYKSAPCSYDKSHVIEIYSNAKYDSELRINAYLALMTCPTEENIELVKGKLMSESANQVGTFVWTHLYNLQESASHEKQWIRTLIGEESLKTKFNSTAIQFSRNMETSFYMEELGLGSTVESNVIFSSNSFLPRSGMFNLSFDLFGESINFIEVGGRFEGFEIFAQKFFGTDGYYPDETIEGILKALRQGKEEEETTFERMWGHEESQPEGSYYMRLFGTDVQYHNFHGIDNIYEMQPRFDLSEFLTKFMNSGETQYSKSYKFVDTELQYPTMSGFPLSLKLNGTANIGFKVDGEFSMRGFTDMDIHGHVYPSAAFEMDASMMVDTHFAKSGMKMRLNGQTSVMLDGNMKVDDAKIVDITLNMPKQEQIQLLSVKSDLVVIKNNEELGPKSDDTTKIESSCMPIIGTELCGQYGPNEVSIFISKTDVHDSYKLRYLNEGNSVSFLVDMPNSAFDRKISFTAMKHGDELKMDIHTPWKSITSTALVALEGNEPKVDIEMTIDNVRKYQGGVELRNNRIGTMQTYIPSIFLMTSGQKIVDITGRIERESSENKLEVTIESKGLLPANVKYSRDPKRGSTAIDISFNSPILDVSAKFGNELNNNNLHTELELEYNFMRQNTDKIKFNINFNDVSTTGSRNKYLGSLDFEMNNLPFHKIHFDTEVMCNDEDLMIKTNTAAGDIFSMDTESMYKHVTRDNFRELRFDFSSKSKTHPSFDAEHSEHWRIDNNKYLGEITNKFMGGEADQKIEAEYSSDFGFVKLHRGLKVRGLQHDTSAEASYSRVSDGQYNTKVSFNDNRNLMGYQQETTTFNWEGSVIERSAYGRLIDNEVSIKWNLNDNHHEARLTTKANDETLNINGVSIYNGDEKFIRINGDSSSIDLKTNLAGRIFSLGAKFDLESSAYNLIEVTGQWGEKTMESRIRTDEDSVEAEFGFDAVMRKIRAEITATGAKVTLKFSPTETVEGELHYNISANNSDVKVVVKTPFGAYTKQELILSFNRPAHNEFSSMIGLTWKNMNMITINASGRLESGTDSNEAMLSVSSINDPSTFGFSRGSFLVEHNRRNYNLDDNIEGHIDGVQVVKGTVKTNVENTLSTVDVRLSTSVHDFITLSIENDYMKSGNLKFKYDTYTIESNYILSFERTSQSLEFHFNSPQLTTMSARLVREMYDNGSKTYKAESEINGKKYIVSIENAIISSSEDTTCTVSAVITLPSMNPIRGSMKLYKSKVNYEINIEMTRFWADHGSIKYHGSLNLRSALGANLIMTWTCPSMNISMDFSYEVGHETLDAHLKVDSGSNTHKLVIGGQWTPKLYRIESTISSSLLNNEISLEAKMDNTSFSVSLQNGLSSGKLYLAGQLIGDSASLQWNTPFPGFERFETHGSLDRSKRSAEFSMMNDASSAGIRASFNSLSIKVTTPYTSARESSFLMERKSNGEVQLHYKRNDNTVDFSATPTGQKRRFNISLTSAVPGWEFLALTGRLDQEELLGYLSGQINEAKMTVSGGGHYSRKNTKLNFNITTPYTGYENISAKLEFNFNLRNIARSNFTLDIRSSSPSSQFHMLVRRDQATGLTIDVYLPHREAPTIIDGRVQVGTGIGHLKFSSRFSSIPSLHLEYSFNRNQQNFEMHLRRGGHHSEIIFRRTTQRSMLFTFRRDGKEFKYEAQNTGTFPVRGKLTFAINNSFRAVPRTITGSLSYDRSGNDKTFDLKLILPNNRTFEAQGNYNINLGRPQKGNYDAIIKISGRQHQINGSWDMSNHDNVSIKIKVDRSEYEIKGKLSLLNTNVSLTSSLRRFEKIDFEWKFSRNDYYLKVGSARRFVMGKLKVDPRGSQGRHVTISIQASRFMRQPLELEFIWKHDSTNGLTANGTYEYGSKNGSFNLSKLKRTASTRSFELRFEANTNNPAINKITVNCDYSFSNAARFNLDINWGNTKVGLHFDINNITSDFTQQTAKLTLPGYGDIEINFGHDFRERVKKFTVTSSLQGRQSYLKAEWRRNRNSSKFNGKIDVESIFLGKINFQGSYDFRDFNNAKADMKYTRENRGTNKFFNFEFKRQLTATELVSKINFSSSNPFATTAKMEVHAKFTNGFDLKVLLQRLNRKVELSFNISQNGLTGRLTTPYPGMELMTGSFTYNLTNPNRKTATLKYERGNRKINMDMELTLRGSQGNLKVTAVTPFEIIKTLNLDANWGNGMGTVEYKRNNISYRFEGTADVKTDRSSFDLTFTPNSGQPIHIMFSFNIGSILSGTGSYAEDIAKMELEMLGKRISFDLKGYRGTGRVVLEFEGESSFNLTGIRQIEFKLDSELNMHKRKGSLEIKVDNFYFNVNNSFEMKRNNGYYWRSAFDSSLTTLPGLIVGFGRDELGARILTVGYGDEREITVTFQPKQNLTTGFSGTISAPHRGIHDASFDINYKFTNQNELDLDVNLQLEPGKMISIDIIYNSEGVQARLTSPMGSHRARARRSVSDNSFYGEIGLDDYSITLRGDNLSADSKKGFKLEGEVFGHRIAVDSLLQIVGHDYAEGKFLIDSNIPGYETIGVIFKFSNENDILLAQSQINLPSTTMPQIVVKLEAEKADSKRAKLQLIVGDQEYNFDGKYNLLNGYGAEISVETPHHVLSKLTMKGKLIMNTMNKIDANLDIIYPSGVFNMTTKYDVSPSNISASMKVECICNNMPTCIVDAIFEKSHGNITAKTAIESKYISNPMSFEFLLSDSKLEITSKIFGETHLVILDKQTSKDEHYSISLIASSTIINGRWTIENVVSRTTTGVNPLFKLDISKSGDASFKFSSYIDTKYGEDTVYIMVNTRTNNAVFNIKKTENSLDILINEKSHEHKLSLSMLHDINDAINKVVSLDLTVTSPALSHDILSNMKVEITDSKGLIENSITFGKVTHHMTAGYSYTSNSADFVLELETPIFNINKMSLKSEVKIGVDIKATASMDLLGSSNTFDLRFSEGVHKKKVVCVVTSDRWIDGKTFKIEGSINGLSTMDLNVLGRIRFSGQTFATKFALDLSSPNNITSSLEVKTPFKGYRKMNFDLSLKQMDDIKIMFRAHDLFPLKFELEAGKYNESYKSIVNIETSMQGFEKITINAEVPMNKTATKVTIQLPNNVHGFEFEFGNELFSKKAALMLIYDGHHYGGGFNLRYKAPYELDVFTNDNRFHVMMDSTMYNMLYNHMF